MAFTFSLQIRAVHLWNFCYLRPFVQAVSFLVSRLKVNMILVKSNNSGQLFSGVSHPMTPCHRMTLAGIQK
jgi:hypothetical protein